MYYRNNVCGTLSLLDAMCQCGVKRLVFSSSAAVYGIPSSLPIHEDSCLSPISPYGQSKLMVERILADYASVNELGFAALRYFNAAGASPAGDIGEHHVPETRLIPLALQVALRQRESIDILGTDYPTPDGTCIRDYVHVDDLAAAHLQALEWIEPGRGRAFNLGIGRGFSVRKVIRACEEVSGQRIPVRPKPRREGDPPKLIASPQRAFEELSWKPQYTDLRSIIETTWRWHREHPQGYSS